MAGIPDIRARIAVSVARVINVNVDLAGRGSSAARPIGTFIGTCSALLPPAFAYVICRFVGASVAVTVFGCLGVAGAAATLRVSMARQPRRRTAGDSRRRSGPGRPRNRREILAVEDPKRKRPGGRSRRRSDTRKRKARREKDRRRPRR